MTAVTISGQSIERLTYRGEPVITIPMVADLHQRDAQSVRKNFTNNKDRFIEQKDFFRLQFDEWSKILVGKNLLDQDAKNDHGGHRGEMCFFTQVGYLKLIKTFNDDLAWDIYIQLVEHYFATRPRIGNNFSPNRDYIAWLREQRMRMAEERKFQAMALSEANRLTRCNGNAEQDLYYVPILSMAVESIMNREPKKPEQLPIFESPEAQIVNEED